MHPIVGDIAYSSYYDIREVEKSVVEVQEWIDFVKLAVKTSEYNVGYQITQLNVKYNFVEELSHNVSTKGTANCLAATYKLERKGKLIHSIQFTRLHSAL